MLNLLNFSSANIILKQTIQYKILFFLNTT